ncbi:MAG: WD repeat protein Lub1 [Sporothrix epigloea]
MADSASYFQLSACLSGHDKDVRAVCFPTPGFVFTASRDCAVQAWHETSESPPEYTMSLLAQGPYSFNSLAFLPPSTSRPQYPKGLLLAGSQGQSIEVRRPDSDISDARVALLSGHSSNVSALSVSPNGEFVVSGDWDGRVKLWNTSTWESRLQLVGPDPNDKQRAIWAVLAYSDGIIMTGSADHVIRGYSLQNNTEKEGELQPGVLIRTPDVVRALCRARKHPSRAQIASAGNDFMIRLWQFNGAQVGTLRGHESFIYALESLPTGELQVGDINPSTLAGPEFIETKSGTKDGQTVMINSGGGNISVYQWSMGENQWLLVGSVVDSSAQEAETPSIDMTSSTPATRAESGSEGRKSISHPLGPQAVFITLTQANFTPALNRIESINSNFLKQQNGAELALSPEQISQLRSLVATLAKDVSSVPTTIPAMVPAIAKVSFTVEPKTIPLILKVATAWPYKDRLPGLDILRCMAPCVSLAEYTDNEGNSVLDTLVPSILDYAKKNGTELALDPKSVENNAMMALRIITNLFATAAGQQLIAKTAGEVVEFLSRVLDIAGRNARNLMVAWTSAASNLTAFALRQQEAEGRNSIGEYAAQLIKLLAIPVLDAADAEVVYRALIALGNLASIPGQGEYAAQVRSASARTWIKLAMDKVEDARVKAVGEELLQLLRA